MSTSCLPASSGTDVEPMWSTRMISRRPTAAKRSISRPAWSGHEGSGSNRTACWRRGARRPARRFASNGTIRSVHSVSTTSRTWSAESATSIHASGSSDRPSPAPITSWHSGHWDRGSAPSRRTTTVGSSSRHGGHWSGTTAPSSPSRSATTEPTRRSVPISPTQSIRSGYSGAKSLPSGRRSSAAADDDKGMSGTAVPRPDGSNDLLAAYDETLPHVYGYLLSRCGQATLAEDLTAETFLAAVDAVRSDQDPP